MSSSSNGSGVVFTPLLISAAPAASSAVYRTMQPEPQLARTFYQDGRLLTAQDLNRDFSYFDQRLRDLGQALGDGIVSGADVYVAPEDRHLHLGGFQQHRRQLRTSIRRHRRHPIGARATQ